jgi:hypothetical protein
MTITADMERHYRALREALPDITALEAALIVAKREYPDDKDRREAGARSLVKRVEGYEDKLYEASRGVTFTK